MTDPAPPTEGQTQPPPSFADHAVACAAASKMLQGHCQTLNRLLALLTDAAEDATDKGRHQALAELARVATSVQAGAARAAAGVLTLETEGRLPAAALGRGGPRGPLLVVGDADGQ